MMKENNEKIPIITIEQFINYFLDNNYSENMFKDDGHINPKYNSFKSTGIISQIFEDNWDDFYQGDNKKLIDNTKIPLRKQIYKYELSILKSFNRNPLYCPHCDVKMDYIAFIT